MYTSSLKDLASPSAYLAPLVISDLPSEILIGYLTAIVRMRRIEEFIAVQRKNSVILGPVHLGIGQEAVAVGVTSGLKPSDCVFGAHRSHSHLLSLGSNLQSFFAELLGKPSGLSGGMGGSMHLIDQSVGFYGSVPIVAGTVPLAVGAALARRMQGTDSIGVAYLGDGAMEEGVVHESLNLAKVINAPTLFVVENNFYASHMHIHLRQPDDSVARFAMANRVPYKVVDGNDVIAVASAARELIQYSRSTGAPALIEAVTYRWLGHVDWRDDIDVGVDRSAETLAQWKARDPLARLAQSMLSQNICTQDDMVDLEREVTREIEVAWQKAKSGVDHDGSNLLRNVYA